MILLFLCAINPSNSISMVDRPEKLRLDNVESVLQQWFPWQIRFHDWGVRRSKKCVTPRTGERDEERLGKTRSEDRSAAAIVTIADDDTSRYPSFCFLLAKDRLLDRGREDAGPSSEQDSLKLLVL